MGELTAQIIQRGRGAHTEETVRRRKLAKDVRAVREKLTSSIGLERAFEYELVRLFAQQRIGASWHLAVLAVAMAGASTLWIPFRDSAFWFALVLSAIAIMLSLSHRFMRQDADAVSLRAWRRRPRGPQAPRARAKNPTPSGSPTAARGGPIREIAALPWADD